VFGNRFDMRRFEQCNVNGKILPVGGVDALGQAAPLIIFTFFSFYFRLSVHMKPPYLLIKQAFYTRGVPERGVYMLCHVKGARFECDPMCCCGVL
jgi:hypothetical protein